MTNSQNSEVERTNSSSAPGQFEDQDQNQEPKNIHGYINNNWNLLQWRLSNDQDQEPKDIDGYVNFHFDLLQWRLAEEKKMMEANKYQDEEEQQGDMEEEREEDGATPMEEDVYEDIQRNPQDHEAWDDVIEDTTEVREIVQDEDEIWRHRALWQVHDDTED